MKTYNPGDPDWEIVVPCVSNQNERGVIQKGLRHIASQSNPSWISCCFVALCRLFCVPYDMGVGLLSLCLHICFGMTCNKTLFWVRKTMGYGLVGMLMAASVVTVTGVPHSVVDFRHWGFSTLHGLERIRHVEFLQSWVETVFGFAFVETHTLVFTSAAYIWTAWFLRTWYLKRRGYPLLWVTLDTAGTDMDPRYNDVTAGMQDNKNAKALAKLRQLRHNVSQPSLVQQQLQLKHRSFENPNAFGILQHYFVYNDGLLPCQRDMWDIRHRCEPFATRWDRFVEWLPSTFAVCKSQYTYSLLVGNPGNRSSMLDFPRTQQLHKLLATNYPFVISFRDCGVVLASHWPVLALKRKNHIRSFGWLLVGQQIDIHTPSLDSLVWIYTIFIRNWTSRSFDRNCNALWSALDDDQTHCPSSGVLLCVTFDDSVSQDIRSRFLSCNRVQNSTSVMVNTSYVTEPNAAPETSSVLGSVSTSEWGSFTGRSWNQQRLTSSDSISSSLQLFFETQFANRSPYHRFGTAWDRKECKVVPEKSVSSSGFSLYAPLLCTYYPNPLAFADIGHAAKTKSMHEGNWRTSDLPLLSKKGCGCRKT